MTKAPQFDVMTLNVDVTLEADEAGRSRIVPLPRMAVRSGLTTKTTA